MKKIFDIDKIVFTNNKESEILVMLNNSSYSIKGTKALALQEIIEDLVNIVKNNIGTEELDLESELI